MASDMNTELMDQRGKNFRINGDRLWDSLMEMAKIGPGVAGGNNRQTLTDEDAEGRRLYQAWCEAEGVEMGLAKMGTMFARREGTDSADELKRLGVLPAPWTMFVPQPGAPRRVRTAWARVCVRGSPGGCWPLAAGCWLLAASCWLLFAAVCHCLLLFAFAA